MAGAILVLGLGFGLAWGQATRLSIEGDAIVATRSAMHLFFWVLSLAVTQVLATFASIAWVGAGLLTMFFSAGATLGTSANLLLRRSRFKSVRTEVST